ncbi:MAG: hypothetical protein OXC84_13390 [Gammaproteobacteria bacterium]|nr:hypothetical protein [Gammaproteobacteria bacterium]
MVVDEDTYEERWESLSEESLAEAEKLRSTIMELSVDIAGAARASPMLAEADMQELRLSTRQMLANVRFREYRHSGVYVHHDEDMVLGVDPPSHEYLMVRDTAAARMLFDEASAKILDLVDLLSPTDATESAHLNTSNYRPNTAFIMMAIDSSKPELEDIRNSIKEVFKKFGIHAITAEDIEHEDAITARILDEIDTSEFHIADLTYERPNVYYEVGYAHARNKRVILYRKKGSKLHFDLAHRNCPEYENATALKKKLRMRLEAMTNKRNPVGGR